MRGAVSLACLLIIVGCRTPWFDSARDALLTESPADTRAVLSHKAGELLGGGPVLLAKDAFLASSTVTIERTARRDSAGLRVDGRSEGLPKVLRLQIAEGSCYLRLDSSDRWVKLDELNCRPAP